MVSIRSYQLSLVLQNHIDDTVTHLRFKSGFCLQENTLILIQFCFSTLINLLVPDFNTATRYYIYSAYLKHWISSNSSVWCTMSYVHCGNKQISVSLLCVQCFLLGIILVPLRSLFLFLVLIPAWIVSILITFKCPLKGEVEPFTGWRR